MAPRLLVGDHFPEFGLDLAAALVTLMNNVFLNQPMTRQKTKLECFEKKMGGGACLAFAGAP